MVLPIFIDEGLHLKGITDGGKYLPCWIYGLAAARSADPLRAARTCGVLFGLAAALGLARLGRELYGDAVGRVAACFYLVLPWALLSDRMAMADSLLAALLVHGLLYGARWARTADLSSGVALGIAVGLAGLCKLYGLLLTFLLPAAFATVWPGAPRRRLLGQLPIVQGVALALLLPLLADIETARRYAQLKFGHLTAAAAGSGSFVTELAAALLQSLQYLTPVGSVLVLGALVAALLEGDRRNRILVVVSAAWFLFFMGIARSSWFLRYLFPAALPLLLLGARWVVRASEAARQRWGRAGGWVQGASVALFFAAALPCDAALLMDPVAAPLPVLDRLEYVESGSSGYGVREVADFLKRAAASGGEVVVLRDARSGPLLEGLDLTLVRAPASLRFVNVYLDDADLPPVADVAAEPGAAYLIRQQPTAEVSVLDLGGRFRLSPVAVFPKPGRKRQMEIYRVTPSR